MSKKPISTEQQNALVPDSIETYRQEYEESIFRFFERFTSGTTLYLDCPSGSKLWLAQTDERDAMSSEHISQCPRCQTILQMVQSSDEPQIPVLKPQTQSKEFWASMLRSLNGLYRFSKPQHVLPYVMVVTVLLAVLAIVYIQRSSTSSHPQLIVSVPEDKYWLVRNWLIQALTIEQDLSLSPPEKIKKLRDLDTNFPINEKLKEVRSANLEKGKRAELFQLTENVRNRLTILKAHNDVRSLRNDTPVLGMAVQQESEPAVTEVLAAVSQTTAKEAGSNAELENAAATVKALEQVRFTGLTDQTIELTILSAGESPEERKRIETNLNAIQKQRQISIKVDWTSKSGFRSSSTPPNSLKPTLVSSNPF